eukprot:357492-Chlamydomonas_euryale.AAC.2
MVHAEHCVCVYICVSIPVACGLSQCVCQRHSRRLSRSMGADSDVRPHVISGECPPIANKWHLFGGLDS